MMILYLSKYCGAVYVAGVLANNALDLQWDVESIVSEAFKSATANRPPSIAREAIELVGEWIEVNRRQFECSCVEAVSDEFFGRMLNDRENGEQRIAILPCHLQKLLTGHGYSCSSVMKQWKDNGWLDTDSSRINKKVRLGGTPIYMIVLNKSGIIASRGNFLLDDLDVLD